MYDILILVMGRKVKSGLYISCKAMP